MDKAPSFPHLVPMKSLLAVLFAAFFALSARAADRPNVVILLADDLGCKDIGCYDGPVKTPTLDASRRAERAFRPFILAVRSAPPRGPRS